MAASNGQRVAAFLLASLFLVTTIGTTAYVIWQINQDDPVVINDTNVAHNQTQQTEAPVQNTNSVVGTTISNFNGAVSVPTLRFDDTTVGDGDTVQPGDTITIQYTGALASDGTIFDASKAGNPAKFPLNNLITGWQEGIPGMKVGGKRRLYIPASQGYGASGSGSLIPPNSDLIFDIELLATERS